MKSKPIETIEELKLRVFTGPLTVEVVDAALDLACAIGKVEACDKQLEELRQKIFTSQVPA